MKELKRTKRVEILREKTFRRPEICLEKPYWYTESHKTTHGEKEVIRRAKATAHVLDNMSIYIDEGELIVGRLTSKVRGGLLNPELNGFEWLPEELETIQDREWDKYAPIPDEDKVKIREFADYWKDKHSVYFCHKQITPETAAVEGLLNIGTMSTTGHHLGHMNIGFERPLHNGLEEIIADVEKKQAALNVAYPEDAHKYFNYEAWKISLNSIIRFANRYADLADQMAETETDPVRKAELKEIARIGRKVPAKPAETFWEALQSMWYIYVGVMIEGCSNGIGFGRMDQYLYPFYRHDIDNGIMTHEQIVELLALMNVKINGVTIPLSAMASSLMGGFCLACDITVGGIDEDGNDAVNDLSYALMDAQLMSHTRADDLVVRVHFNNPDRFVMRALEVSTKLSGKIKWVGDESTIQTMLQDGKTIQMARNYSIDGCFQPTVDGESIDVPAGTANNMMFLDLALHRGYLPMVDKQIGPVTEDPRNFKSYEDLWNAFTTQVDALMGYTVSLNNEDWKIRSELIPCAFASPFYKECVERGLDITEGGTSPYLTMCVLLAGLPNVGNSLAALKKCVFEDKTLTMDQVMDAIDNDFEGYPDVLNILRNAPKYGNDDPYVDKLVNDATKYVSDAVTKYHGHYGLKWTGAGASLTANIVMGLSIGASPDGRKARTPLAEGGISPYQGTNISGLAPTLNSVAKLDHSKFTGGTVLNVRISTAMVKDEANFKRVANMIRTYFQMGGMLAQFNIVGTDTLIEAQKHPEQYKDLLVRVSTYSAYFVELSPFLQNDIIIRSVAEN